MHGRLKVRTSEEQQLIKEKQQKQKLLAYRHGMLLIQSKRHEKPYDKESFAICAGILEKNPDVYTLWNYRKEVMLTLIDDLSDKTKKVKEEFVENLKNDYDVSDKGLVTIISMLDDYFKEKSDDTSNVENARNSFNKHLENIKTQQAIPIEIISDLEEMFVRTCTLDETQGLDDQSLIEKQLGFYCRLLKLRLIKLMQQELDLTERCLLANPKSYGAWHHRFWILQHHPKADWQQELKLVEKYLKYDERNFHSWDYRRLLLKKLGYKIDAELEFSTDKINANFSNYSSWHYRSTLKELNAETLEDELRLVQNAVFTDPYDSSTWFYLRWVLSNRAVSEKHREALLSDFEQLLELEPNCKWVYMAKCWIAGSLSLSNKDAIKKNLDVYRKLMELDPMRKGMYADYIKIGEEGDQE